MKWSINRVIVKSSQLCEKSAILLACLYLVGCTSIPEGHVSTPRLNNEARAVDIHAHFFNGMDIEPGNFTRLLAPRVKTIRIANKVTNYGIKSVARKRVKRLAQDRGLENSWFENPEDILISKALTNYNSSGPLGLLNDFVDSASTSRQGIVLSYFQNYPEVGLVTPSLVDFQGFAEGSRRDGKVNDSWGASLIKSVGDAYATTASKRHEIQRKLAVDFNKKFHQKGSPAILPIAGFNPLHGVRDQCGNQENKKTQSCHERFDFFQWGSVSTENYADDFIKKYIDSDSESNFMGIKIYPQAGFYPIENCKNAIRTFTSRYPKKDVWLKSNRKRLNGVLPYAPLENFWSKVGGIEPYPNASQSCSTLKNVVTSFCQSKGSGCPTDTLGKQLKSSVALAPELDEQLNKMWLAAYELGFPIITHASPAGAKQGSGFEKYGSLIVWEAFETDIRSLIAKTFPNQSCEDLPIRILLAHSDANKDFSNKGFIRMIEFLHRNWERRGQTCVEFYVDFSDTYLQAGVGKLNFDHVVKKNKYLREESEFRNAFLELIRNGRILYGSDYFMSTLASGEDFPNNYFTGHNGWVENLDEREGSKRDIKNSYLRSGALKFLGLKGDGDKKDTSLACSRARSWFDGEPHPWLSSLCR